MKRSRFKSLRSIASGSAATETTFHTANISLLPEIGFTKQYPRYQFQKSEGTSSGTIQKLYFQVKNFEILTGHGSSGGPLYL
uniref:Uncharacterized protein n=1 Tax=Romanomermis culicivorax TaxID=13658 RepID=A0A915L4M1_ROMCU